jgi:divalent metal cation (Fe/Co/Zn/Cd) transporter
MFEGGKLMRFAIRGIMDTVNEDQDKRIRDVLSNDLPPQIRSWHKLRHRTTGHTTWVELHVLMDDDLALKEAHRISTLLEKRIMKAVDGDAVVTLHMEPEHEHEHAHGVLAGINDVRIWTITNKDTRIHERIAPTLASGHRRIEIRHTIGAVCGAVV